MRRAFTATLAILAVGLTTLANAADDAGPIKVLIVTGDNVGAHDWKATSAAFKDLLDASGRCKADITSTPSKDLTDENLARYDVILLNYANTAQGSADSKWSDANKASFLKAVREGGKGLVVYHFSSAAFARPNWEEFEKAVAGGWRTQGYHGPAHEFTVKKTPVKHPVSEGLPAEFPHVTDELYSASLRTRGSLVLATAYCDPSKPQGTGADEAVVWVNQYGKGRVYNNVLGHDVKALTDPGVKAWFLHGVEWAATGKVGSSAR